jgi:hypothetical protein
MTCAVTAAGSAGSFMSPRDSLRLRRGLVPAETGTLAAAGD